MNNKFLKNTGWIISSKIFQMIISLFISTVTVRYLGPDNYGLLSYSTSFVVLFSSISNLGLNGIIVNELLNNPEKEGEIIGTGIAMRFFASILCLLSIQFLILLLNGNDKILLLISILQSLVLIFSSFDMIIYWYQTKLMSKYVSIIQMLTYIIVAAYKMYILYMGKGIVWFAFSNTFDIGLISLLLCLVYFYHGGDNFSFSFSRSISLIQKSYHFIIAGVMVSLFSQIDRLMIANMMDNRSVGLYSTAMILCTLWSFIPIALIDSARPIIIGYKNTNSSMYITRLKQLYASIIWLSIFYGIFMFIFGKYILIILYGVEYIDALPALQIVVWYCSFSFLGNAKNIWLIAEGKSRFEVIFSFFGFIFNMVLNYCLIPIFGIVGAAIATLLTNIITIIILPMFFKETRINVGYILEGFLLRNIK